MSIEIKKLEHTYNENTPFSHAALKGIDLSIPEGKVTAIIGQTGSGKSTLVQHLNGLLIPTAGTLDICGFHIQPLLIDAFGKAGFTSSQVDKILSENVLRVYKEVLV